mgnify:CR=1 FL=1
MSEWMTKKLGEVAEIAIGGTPSRSIPSYWASETNTGYPWVSIGDLGPRRIYETKEEITDDGVRFSNVKKVEGGTVIMSFKLTIGKTAIAGCDLFTNEAIVAVRPFANVLSNRLLYYILPEAAGRTVTESAIKGATLNKKKLFDIPLSFPADISEQEDIARILSSADEQIGKTETLIAKYQQIKAGLMHSLFTRGLEANGALRPMQEDKPDIYQLINGFTAPREWRILKCADLCSRICVGIVISERKRGWCMPGRYGLYFLIRQFFAREKPNKNRRYPDSSDRISGDKRGGSALTKWLQLY